MPTQNLFQQEQSITVAFPSEIWQTLMKINERWKKIKNFEEKSKPVEDTHVKSKQSKLHVPDFPRMTDEEIINVLESCLKLYDFYNLYKGLLASLSLNGTLNQEQLYEVTYSFETIFKMFADPLATVCLDVHK